jgi:hypothetical protein
VEDVAHLTTFPFRGRPLVGGGCTPLLLGQACQEHPDFVTVVHMGPRICFILSKQVGVSLTFAPKFLCCKGMRLPGSLDNHAPGL